MPTKRQKFRPFDSMVTQEYGAMSPRKPAYLPPEVAEQYQKIGLGEIVEETASVASDLAMQVAQLQQQLAVLQQSMQAPPTLETATVAKSSRSTKRGRPAKKAVEDAPD